MSRFLAAALAVGFLPLLSPPAAGQMEESDVGHCQAIYTEVWELRARGKDSPANNLNNRMRRLGCFEAPVSDGLCPVLDRQEILREADGNDNLANVIRAQQQRFFCS